MKKILSILTLITIMVIPFFVNAQQTWKLQDGKILLFTNTSLVGIGCTDPTEKTTIESTDGKTVLGLKGYSTQLNPFIYLKDYRGRTIVKVFGNYSYWTLGTVFDSLTALISGDNSKKWLRINDYLYVKTKIKTAAGEFSGAVAANGGITSTAYQQIDTTSFASNTVVVVTAGKMYVAAWNHYNSIQAVDSVSIANLAVGETMTVIRLGGTPRLTGGAASTTKTTVKAINRGLVSGATYFYPNSGSTTGAATVDLTTADPIKHFYKKDATHIWIY